MPRVLILNRDYSGLRHILPDTLNNKVYLFYDHSYEEIGYPAFERKSFGYHTKPDFIIKDRIPI
ncbi:MAG: hypothetical protein U5K51_02270 [Flavobacteriaceae bacterium]|nr:hypothetical protein [Flavobacteriaceae bacterium]